MNFDLNIDNYTHDELEQMFGLPENYDASIIDVHEAKLKDGILKNREIDEQTQLKTIDFLVKAKQIIMRDPTKSRRATIQEKISDVFNSNFKLQETKVINEHMIQERPNKSYSSSYPSEYFAGVINPLKKKTTRKNLNIDSRFRENYYSSPATNYNIVLPMNMNNVLSMQLNSVEIPTSYFCVSKQYGNNFFHIAVDGY
jgi:hypothetical protein